MGLVMELEICAGGNEGAGACGVSEMEGDSESDVLRGGSRNCRLDLALCGMIRTNSCSFMVCGGRKEQWRSRMDRDVEQWRQQ